MDTAYLYSMWSGVLVVYQGSVYRGKDERQGQFKTLSGKRFQCSSTEAVVLNSVVWLLERDDRKATKIIKKHLKNQISDHKEKIHRLKTKIKVLKRFKTSPLGHVNRIERDNDGLHIYADFNKKKKKMKKLIGDKYGNV